MNTKSLGSIYTKNIVQEASLYLPTINKVTTDNLNEQYNIHIGSFNELIAILRLINENITSLEHVKCFTNKALNSENCFSVYGSDWTEVRCSADNYFNINC